MNITTGKAEYSPEGLKQLIDSHDVISFDIFDTLVMRKSYFNKDVFRMVAEKYKQIDPAEFFKARVEAEYNLSRTRYPFMEEIYAEVGEKLGLSKELAEEIMNCEIAVEKAIIIPRKASVDIFEYCKDKGKKVYIVSDMYMCRKTLEKIINDLGIVGYDGIFVSCEYNTSKPQHLFDCYVKEVKADSYLHIGDSEECDILPAAKLGIDNFRLKTSAEMWESDGGVVPSGLEERSKVAEFICEKYNSPFAKVQ